MYMIVFIYKCIVMHMYKYKYNYTFNHTYNNIMYISKSCGEY